MTSPTHLLDRLRDLYLQSPQTWHSGKLRDGDAVYLPVDAPLTPGNLQAAHQDTGPAVALNLVSSGGMVRTMVLDFDNVADWTRIRPLHQELVALGMAPPAVSVSGRKGFGLWLSIDAGVPVADAQTFLRLLRTYAGLPGEHLDLRPDTDKPTSAGLAVMKLPPCRHPASGKWSAFIRLDDLPQYAQAPYLESAPDLEDQAQILDEIESSSRAAFLGALDFLKRSALLRFPDHHHASAAPQLEKLPEGALPVCIRTLVEKGVPSGMDYNAANLNLFNYAAAAGLGPAAGEVLATRMAEASQDHPTSKKTLEAKLRNYRSNREARPFSCSYPRGIAPWRDHMGGREACAGCAANPDTSGIPEVVLRLEAAAALDLLAHGWRTETSYPQLRRVWPTEILTTRFNRPLELPLYELAAAAKNASALFHQVDIWVSEKRIAEIRPEAQARAQELAQRIQAHLPAPGAITAALARARDLEKRLSLQEEARRVLGATGETPANLLAVQLRTAAEETLKADAATGPLQAHRQALYEAFTRDGSGAAVPTPFPTLNALLNGGFRERSLYAVVAPPKAGKTTLTAVWMDHAAALGHPVLYVGYEMGRAQMLAYALARRTGINSNKIESRHLTEVEAELIAGSLEGYLATVGANLEIWEAGLQTTLADVSAWVTRARSTHPGKTPLVVIDYLQLARTGIREVDANQSETKRVSDVAVACKNLARESGAAVIALSSVTKSAETTSGTDGSIDVTAARDSLAIVHAADGLFTLQARSVVRTEGRGENKAETLLDPWQWLAKDLYADDHPASISLERAIAKKDSDYPARERSGGFGTRARLTLERHRGNTGPVLLYYRKAFHAFEEVSFPGLGPDHGSRDATPEALAVFRRSVDTSPPPQDAPRTPSEAADESRPGAAPAQGAGAAPCTFLRDLDAAAGLLANIPPGSVVGLDFETTGLSPLEGSARLLSVDFGGQALVLDLWAMGGLTALRQVLEEALASCTVVAHNAAFEQSFLRHAGINLKLECTLLAEHVLTGKMRKLADLAEAYLGQAVDKTLQTSDWSAKEISPGQIDYAALDAILARRLWPTRREALEQEQALRAYELARDAVPAVVDMRLAGMRFDRDAQTKLMADLTTRRDTLEEELKAGLGVENPASGKQLSEWLAQQLGGEGSAAYAEWPKTGTGQLKSGADDLVRFAKGLPPASADLVKTKLLPFKDVAKKVSAFGESLAAHINPITGRIHADYNLAGTVTGRMSCSRPNMQQMPRDKVFRALFVPAAGHAFVIADFSQMELRVAAEIAQEEKLLEAYRKGQDTHKLTAALLLGKTPDDVTKAERQIAKAVNFGLLFGQGAKGLQEKAESDYGVTITLEQAEKHRNAWFKAYPAFRAWHTRSRKQAERALEVRTPAGRPRRWDTAEEFRANEAYNTPVQGGAAEATLAALARIHARLPELEGRVVAVVHDEVILEVPQERASAACEALAEAMTQGFAAIFPGAPVLDLVEATVASSWADK